MNMSSPTPDSTGIQLFCDDTKCVDPEKDVLICVKCRRRVHYKCTRFSAYQIHVIKTNRTNIYYCSNCVIVPRKLLDLVPLQNHSLSVSNSKKEINRLRREIEACEALIKNHESNNDQSQRLLQSIKKQKVLSPRCCSIWKKISRRKWMT